MNVFEQVKECAKRIGCEVIAIKELSNPADSHLRYVLAYNNLKEEYITWMYNVDRDGFAYGNYFPHWFTKTQAEALIEAEKDFQMRGV